MRLYCFAIGFRADENASPDNGEAAYSTIKNRLDFLIFHVMKRLDIGQSL
jgi:hypothetical protein